MTLLQQLVKILRKELDDALMSDDVDTMTNALEKVQRSEPRVYFEKIEERGAMDVCTKAIEDAIASGSDEEIKSKISAAKLLVQQHNKAYKNHVTDESKGKNKHWNENAVVDLIKKADAKLQEIAQKNAERDVRKPLEDAVKSKNLDLLFAALKQAEQKNFTHLQAYTDAKAAITDIIDDDLQRAINLDDEKALR